MLVLIVNLAMRSVVPGDVLRFHMEFESVQNASTQMRFTSTVRLCHRLRPGMAAVDCAESISCTGLVPLKNGELPNDYNFTDQLRERVRSSACVCTSIPLF